MNKQNRLSRVFWLVLALVFCLPISPASSQRSNSDTTLESVGKENPFEVVRPIIDAKKALIAKMVRPSNDTLEQQPVVEIIPDRNMQIRLTASSRSPPIFCRFTERYLLIRPRIPSLFAIPPRNFK